jgi:hypothetical protein
MAPGHKSSRMSPRRCIPPRDPFHTELPCTPPHTISTIPAPAPPATFLSHSCPCPPPLTVTQHGLPAPIHAKDQILRAPVSTTARHSAATAVIVDPTPQIALSVAVATEVVSTFIVMHAVRSIPLRLPRWSFLTRSFEIVFRPDATHNIALRSPPPLYYHQPFEATQTIS